MDKGRMVDECFRSDIMLCDLIQGPGRDTF